MMFELPLGGNSSLKCKGVEKCQSAFRQLLPQSLGINLACVAEKKPDLNLRVS